MLYYLLYSLHEYISPFNVFRYITFRAALATLTAMIISFAMGPWLIRKLKEFQIKQTIRDVVPETHRGKEGTPTMGGLLVLTAIVVPTILWADIKNIFIWILILVIILFGLLGFVDDYLKLRRSRSRGLTIKTKLLCQIAIGGAVAVILELLISKGMYTAELSFPFFKTLTPDLGWLYVPLVIAVIVGASNAVNMTDGLDGLAIGSVLIASATFTILAYVAGHAIVADYLNVTNVRGVGELTVACGGIVGAGLGFLWFNCHPAQIFMGDVGSLALGAAIGTVAVLIKQEILLILVGGLFVMEALSVIIQVISFRFYGKRVFKMAPLHHHFELLGWKESKIIIRFLIIAMIFALLSLSTLKLR